MYWVQKTCL